MNLTAKETAVLAAIATSQYRNGDLHDAVWSHSVAVPGLVTPKSLGGVLGSLSKKGLVVCCSAGNRRSDDDTVELTDTGIALLPEAITARWKRI